MYMVVVARLPPSSEVAATTLVELLGLTLYEARGRLAAAPPRVIAMLADEEASTDLVEALNASGFVALAIDRTRIETDETREHVAALKFGGDEIELTLRDGATRVVPHREIRLLLRGTRTSQHVTVREETKEKFSPGKALLTGGLIMKTKVKTETKITASSHQSFLYVCTEQGPTLAIYEQRMSYAFLGAALQPSSVANFATVVAMFRERAAGAAYDDRLLRPANLGLLPPAPRDVDPEEWRIDVATSVLAISALALGDGAE